MGGGGGAGYMRERELSLCFEDRCVCGREQSIAVISFV